MSEHVITVVDEETNKISSNLRLYSNISTYSYFSFSDSNRSSWCICLFCICWWSIEATKKTKTMNIRISWAANYIDSRHLQHVLILSLPVNNNGKKWGSNVQTLGPYKPVAGCWVSNLSERTLYPVRLSFLPASPSPPFNLI